MTMALGKMDVEKVKRRTMEVMKNTRQDSADEEEEEGARTRGKKPAVPTNNRTIITIS